MEILSLKKRFSRKNRLPRPAPRRAGPTPPRLAGQNRMQIPLKLSQHQGHCKNMEANRKSMATTLIHSSSHYQILPCAMWLSQLKSCIQEITPNFLNSHYFGLLLRSCGYLHPTILLRFLWEMSCLPKGYFWLFVCGANTSSVAFYHQQRGKLTLFLSPSCS